MSEQKPPTDGRPKAPRKPVRSQKTGTRQSSSADRRAAAVLEVLAGVRSPGEAATALGISVNYYYVLERKALRALAIACEPAPKGPPGPSPEKRLEKLERELARCQRECQRQAALVRATQRAVGLPSTDPTATKKNGKTRPSVGRKRRRKPSVRALLAAKSLRENPSSEDPAHQLERASSKEDAGGTIGAQGSKHDATR